jgi:cobalt transporter subunit CbtA
MASDLRHSRALTMRRTIRGTRMDSPVTEFRRLIILALCAGALSGLVLFSTQHFTVIPLIETAESYEKEDHHHEEWKPSEGWERTGWTALTTILSSIGFAALFFGLLSPMDKPASVKEGAVLGAAAFACFHLAPSLGLPPMPPGVPVADVQARQLWWISTVLATALGLWLIAGRTWIRAIAGLVLMAIPHFVGAPAVAGENPVPAELMQRFSIASLATTGVHWLVLGASGGFLSARFRASGPESPVGFSRNSRSVSAS